MIEKLIEETQAELDAMKSEPVYKLPNAIIMGLTARNTIVYAHTVDAEEVARRRAKNKAARRARRASRK